MMCRPTGDDDQYDIYVIYVDIYQPCGVSVCTCISQPYTHVYTHKYTLYLPTVLSNAYSKISIYRIPGM